MSEARLVVLYGADRIGEIVQGDAGRLTLRYDDRWRALPQATPLSLSMPLVAAVHEDRVVRPFLWGLLPDNEQVLERWAREYQVSARNPFALLRNVGEDCAGAAQFVVPERVELLLAGDGGVRWIDEADVAERLRILRRDPTAWHLSESGQFSLAGAQAKTALYFDTVEQRWGEPWGAMPTTHILKPAITGFDEHDLNEHLCLQAARLAGIDAVDSQVMSFRGERAIVVRRYDRVRLDDGSQRRVHQEDLCQAMGVPPGQKYQSEGGPAPEQIIKLLRREVRPPALGASTVDRFVDAVAFNWMISGTDAHAKNYSVLLASAQVRLAPLYDVASALAYDDMYPPKLRSAMRIGGEYRLDIIDGRRWRRFAADNGLDQDRLVGRIAALAERVPECFAIAARAAPVVELASGMPARLTQRVAERVKQCLKSLV